MKLLFPRHTVSIDRPLTTSQEIIDAFLANGGDGGSGDGASGIVPSTMFIDTPTTGKCGLLRTFGYE